MKSLESLLSEIRFCNVCAGKLPHAPSPVVQISEATKILIIGQAPGKKVHISGKPWDDKSGELLRTWFDMSEAIFYNPSLIGHMPMGFCYPGKNKTGDLPPRKECAPLWHKPLLERMNSLQLIFLIGGYSQSLYLKGKQNLTERVRNATSFLPYIPLPHPSPRNFLWYKKNPWFAEDILPFVRTQINNVLNL